MDDTSQQKLLYVKRVRIATYLFLNMLWFSSLDLHCLCYCVPAPTVFFMWKRRVTFWWLTQNFQRFNGRRKTNLLQTMSKTLVLCVSHIICYTQTYIYFLIGAWAQCLCEFELITIIGRIPNNIWYGIKSNKWDKNAPSCACRLFSETEKERSIEMIHCGQTFEMHCILPFIPKINTSTHQFHSICVFTNKME